MIIFLWSIPIMFSLRSRPTKYLWGAFHPFWGVLPPATSVSNASSRQPPRVPPILWPENSSLCVFPQSSALLALQWPKAQSFPILSARWTSTPRSESVILSYAKISCPWERRTQEQPFFTGKRVRTGSEHSPLGRAWKWTATVVEMLPLIKL